MNEPQKTDESRVQCSAWFGRWVYARYGYSIVCGQCLMVDKRGGMVLRFYWGHPWRDRHHVDAEDILGPAADPRWLARLGSLIGISKRPNA